MRSYTSRMADKLDRPGLRELRKALDDATEVLDAFMSTAATAQLPSEILIDAAHKTCGDLAEWHETLEETTRRDEGGYEAH